MSTESGIVQVATWMAVGFLLLLGVILVGAVLAFIWWMSEITHGLFLILVLAGFGILLLRGGSK